MSTNLSWIEQYNALSYTTSKPQVTARLKSTPADFIVIEDLGFELSGEGEHLFLNIQKTGLNTAQVAQTLAQAAKIKLMDVGFSGLKDNYAVTEQWFSLYLPGREWEVPNIDGVKVLASSRHNKKLKRGIHKSNCFEIVLRQCTGDRALWEDKLQQLRANGFANYFTEQRFGRGMSNLDMANKMFADRQFKVRKNKRSMYLSAARSWLFNQVCSARIKQGVWDQSISGEQYILDGTRSFFESDDKAAEDIRLSAFDIHTSGPLWGRCSTTDNMLYQYEHELLEEYESFRHGLEMAGMKLERRALRVRADGLSWKWVGEADLQLKFTLPKGCYATALIREITNT